MGIAVVLWRSLHRRWKREKRGGNCGGQSNREAGRRRARQSISNNISGSRQVVKCCSKFGKEG
jgi:hypothetical protein